MSHERKLGRTVHEQRLSAGALAIGSTLVAKIKQTKKILSEHPINFVWVTSVSP